MCVNYIVAGMSFYHSTDDFNFLVRILLIYMSGYILHSYIYAITVNRKCSAGESFEFFTYCVTIMNFYTGYKCKHFEYSVIVQPQNFYKFMYVQCKKLSPHGTYSIYSILSAAPGIPLTPGGPLPPREPRCPRDPGRPLSPLSPVTISQ